jgi:hypothetical protein
MTDEIPKLTITNDDETPEQMSARHKRVIEAAGVPTEEQMRTTPPASPETIEALCEYVGSLVNRPHDYGTCVYALSHAAVAAFNFVASKLGVTGFQASMADMDILTHTRNFQRGRILDYYNLLYPQYLNSEHFPSWDELLDTQREWLAEEAAKLLKENSDIADVAVAAHWKRLVANGGKP